MEWKAQGGDGDAVCVFRFPVKWVVVVVEVSCRVGWGWCAKCFAFFHTHSPSRVLSVFRFAVLAFLRNSSILMND